MAVFGNTDDSTGKFARILVAGRNVRSVRSTQSHRHSESLSAADTNVGSPLTRRRDQSEGQQIRRSNRQTLVALGLRRQFAVVVDAAIGGWVLNQHAT